MTENDAKDKWCPFARPPGRRYSLNEDLWVSGNRGDSYCNCLGSNCMAWRSDDARGAGWCGLVGEN